MRSLWNCTETTLPNSIFTAVAAYDVMAAIGSIVTIVCVRWTPTLQGLMSDLIISEQSACLISQVLSIFTYLSKGHVSHIARGVASSVMSSSKISSSVFLCMMNLGIYIAVCRPLVFRTNITQLSRRLIIITTWVLTCLVYSLVLLKEDLYHVDCNSDIMVIVFHKGALWIPGTSLGFGLLLPLFINFVCLWRVVKATSTIPSNLTLRQAHVREHNIKKIKLIFANTIIFAVCVIPLNVVFNVSQFIEDVNSWKTAFVALWALTKISQNLRPIVYFVCYTPIRTETKSRLSRIADNQIRPHKDQEEPSTICGRSRTPLTPYRTQTPYHTVHSFNVVRSNHVHVTDI